LLGNIEQYNSSELLPGPSLAPLLPARGQITGFVVYDHYDLLPRWQRLAGEWLASGRLVYLEDRFDGLASAPQAFERLMSGQTMGKVVVVLGDVTP
jgi:NADPH-dependent curcumin reductase CurA